MKMVDMLEACIRNAEKEISLLDSENTKDQKKIQKLQKYIAHAKKHIKDLESA
jgi:peptidoglycan hydrolase CwlO-like protein